MSRLTENHGRHVVQTFLSIHRRLAELEGLLAQSGTESVFSQLNTDLPPAESRVLQDHFARIRAARRAAVDDLALPLEARKTSLRLDPGNASHADPGFRG